MTGDEAEVLGFATRHDLVLGSQIRARLKLSEAAERRAVSELVEGGRLTKLRLAPGREAFVSTPADRSPVDRPAGALPDAVVGRGLRRAVGAVWVWIRAQDGRFPGATVLSAREQVAADLAAMSEPGRLSGSAELYGLRVGGVASDSQTGLHYPDVLVRFHDGWCAVHLQLGPTGADELVARLRRYGADERYGRLVFLVERERVGRQIEQAAVSAGVAGVTLVQWMEWS